MKKLSLITPILLSLLILLGCGNSVNVKGNGTPQDGESYTYEYVMANTSVEIIYHGDPNNTHHYYADDSNIVMSSRFARVLVRGYFERISGLGIRYVYEAGNINIFGNFIVKEYESNK